MKRPEWTGDVVRTMHLEDISVSELREEMCVSRNWVGKVLNGRATPLKREMMYRKAIANILRRREDEVRE